MMGPALTFGAPPAATMPSPLSFLRLLWRSFHCALLPLATAVALPAGAQDHWGVVNFQNDVFVGRDGGGYTSGLYLSSLRRAGDGAAEWPATRLLGALGQAVGGGAPVFHAHTLGHAMATPRDLSTATPDPHDAPYVAALSYRASQVLRTAQGADLWALSVGVSGPAAGGKQVQKFIHRITGSDQPRGWDTQQGNRAHIGLEFERAWLLAGRSASASGGTPWALSAHAGGVASTLESSAGAQLLLRYGSGVGELAEGMGVLSWGSDPLSLRRGWQGFAGLSLRHIFHSQSFRDDEGPMDTRSLRRGRAAVVAGLSYSWGPASLSFAVHSADPATRSSARRQTYGSLTYAFAWR